VRYLAKEETPDFVFLALELCHMTLDQAIDQFNKDPITVANRTRLPPFAVPGDYTRLFLREIASATEHLHNNGIVHCDIKPQNVLVVPRNSKHFLELGSRWVPKLSDMGLSKSLEKEKSSFRLTASTTHAGGGAGKSNGGGTVGWRAPELLMRGVGEQRLRSRVTRKIDVFSLGCLFFYVLENGLHPYGEWLFRESNIVAGNACELRRLLAYCGEAHALISRMLSPNHDHRPSMASTLNDPFLWDSKSRLDFLCDVSDRLELDSTLGITTELADRVFGTSLAVMHDWAARLDPILQMDIVSLRHRRYDVRAVRDLLRYIRNRRHHRDENSKVAELLTHDPYLFLDHFVGPKRFPMLIPICVEWLILTLFIHEPHFASMFGHSQQTSAKGLMVAGIAPARQWMAKDWVSQTAANMAAVPVPKTPVWKTILCDHWERTRGVSCPVGEDCGYAHGLVELRISPFEFPTLDFSLSRVPASPLAQTSKPPHRQWYLEEWSEVATAVEDCVYYPGNTKRILCDHWERSAGTRCVMGNKCGFAHGLVELRGDGFITQASHKSGGGGGGGKKPARKQAMS
jgi:serine/threonine protein kinase